MSNASSPAASPLSLPSCPIPGISTFARALFYIPSKVVEMGLPVSPVWHPVLERLRTRWESCSLLPQLGVALDVFNLRSSCRGCLLNSRGKQQQHITNERQYIRITVLLSIVFVCKVVSMGGYHNRKSPLNFILKGTLSQHNLPLQWRYVTWLAIGCVMERFVTSHLTIGHFLWRGGINVASRKNMVVLSVRITVLRNSS